MKRIPVVLLLAAALASAQLQTPLRLNADRPWLATGLAPSERAPSAGLDFQPLGAAEKKSVGMALLYSLLLPGMGELSLGKYDQGKYFTIAEGVLWLTWGSFQWYGNWVQDDARRFAAQHAGVDPGGKSDQYFIDIGNFRSVYAFNDQVLLDRDPQKLYPPNSAFYWNWDADSDREQYRQLRVASDEAYNDSRFVVAAVLVNHVVSAVNAARLAISHNKAAAESGTLDIRATVLGGVRHPHGIMISFSKDL